MLALQYWLICQKFVIALSQIEDIPPCLFLTSLLYIILLFKGMSNQRLTLVRLQKQQRSINVDPIPNLLVKRKGLLNFHFCIYGLEGAYSGGFYHGVLELAPDYPFSPPQLKFFTESGRFETNKPICTSFTNFHKQQWSSAWNVRTMLLGVISFMTSPQGGYGSIKQSDSKRRLIAQRSLKRNMQNPQFVQLFEQGLKKIKAFSQNSFQPSIPKSPEQQLRKIQNNNTIYFLALILLLVLFGYMLFRDRLVKYTSSIQKQF